MSEVWAGVLFSFSSLSNTCAFWLPSMDLLTSSTPPGAELQETICWWGVSRATFQLAHFYCLDKLCCLEQGDNYKPILLNHIYYYIDELNMEPKPSWIRRGHFYPRPYYDLALLKTIKETGKALHTLNKIFRQAEVTGISWWYDSWDGPRESIKMDH